MSQLLKEFQFVVSLPKKRSRVSLDNPYWEKKLSESQKTLLEIHDKTNWTSVELAQGYKTPKGIMKEILWKITQYAREKRYLWSVQNLRMFQFFISSKQPGFNPTYQIILF